MVAAPRVTGGRQERALEQGRSDAGPGPRGCLLFLRAVCFVFPRTLPIWAATFPSMDAPLLMAQTRAWPRILMPP